MESVSGVRCGIAQGGSCGVRTQGKTIIREREAPTRGTVTAQRHRAQSQGSVSGHDKSSCAGRDDGAVVQEHGTSLPGTTWTWHCDIRDEHGDNCEVQ